MRKLNTKQKKLIINFIKNNPSVPIYLECDAIDPDGSIENINPFENAWSEIERFYSDQTILYRG